MQAITATRSFEAPEPEDSDILIVDDDIELRAEMAAYLTAQGYVVHEAGDGPQARARLAAHPVRLVILDVMLPGEDGLTICRKLAAENGPPVLMLSAMGEPVDRIVGLELGADDYMVKPVNPRELLARIKVMLRRHGGAPRGAGPGPGYAFAGFRFDVTRRQLRAPDGAMLMLTPGEVSLLSAFADRPQAVLSREELLTLARGGDGRGGPGEVLDRAVDIHISRLRRKMHAHTGRELIRTYRGAGYMFDVKVSPA